MVWGPSGIRFGHWYTKTKQKECYTDTVPVFTRGDHPVVGVGFNYEVMQSLSDIQLPYILQPQQNQRRKRDLRNYMKEISILDHSGVSRSTVAEMLNVDRWSVYRLFES